MVALILRRILNDEYFLRPRVHTGVSRGGSMPGTRSWLSGQALAFEGALGYFLEYDRDLVILLIVAAIIWRLLQKKL